MESQKFRLAIGEKQVSVVLVGTATSLNFDRSTGLPVIGGHKIESDAQQKFIYGVLGTINLLAGSYLLVITEAQRVASVAAVPVFRVTRADVVPIHVTKLTSPETRSDEAEYLRLLKAVLSGGTFYFSYDYDLTSSVQRQSAIDPKLPLWQRADDLFFFNRNVQSALIAAKADAFILPVIQGFIESEQFTIGSNSFHYVLLSRRSRFRTGTRYNVRGVDAEGHAANFVETEQIIEFEDKRSALLQTRGSIPLLWTQQPALKYKAQIVINKDEASSEQAFRLHTSFHIKRYGPTTVVDLIDQKGSEGQLGSLFSKMASKSSSLSGPNSLRYVGFDFHKQCAKMRYDKLSELMAQLAKDLDAYGFFTSDARGPKHAQTGVIRTNCIDCLDRTNVVQGLVARTLLPRQLVDVGVVSTVLPDEDIIAKTEVFNRALKHIWANNADALSIQYSGTPALKTDFTRTGKRTVRGSLADGWHSAKRYILANFRDGRRQDGLDLFAGNYVVMKDQPSPLRAPHPGLRLLLVVILFLVALAVARYAFPQADAWAYLRVGVELLLVYALWRGVTTIGHRFVLRPRLVKQR